MQGQDNVVEWKKKCLHKMRENLLLNDQIKTVIIIFSHT